MAHSSTITVTLFTFLIILAVFTKTTSGIRHKCVHDDIIKDNVMITLDMSMTTPANTYGSFRIVPIYNWFPSDMNDILKTRIKDFLVASTNKLAQSLTTNNIVGTLPFVDNNTPPTNKCDSIDIVPDHTSPGVPDADLVVYVTFEQTSKCSTTFTDGAAAYAIVCAVSMPEGKPRYARLNFCPKQFTDVNTSTVVEQAEWIGVTLHELLHASGFSSDFFYNPNGRKYSPTAIAVRVSATDENQGYQITSPSVLVETKKYFNCTSAAGLKLENMGTDIKTIGSHWSKRFAINEVMNAEKTMNPKLTVFTLAALGDLHNGDPKTPWYKPVMAKADTMLWGLKAGCSFLNSDCLKKNSADPPSVLLQNRNFFCNRIEQDPKLQTDKNSRDMCTHNRMGVGYCNYKEWSSTDANKPATAYQYWSNPLAGGENMYAKYCPYVQAYVNKRCDDETLNNLPNVKATGSFYGQNSACMLATVCNDPNVCTTQYMPRCMQYSCDAVNRVISIVVGTSKYACPKVKMSQPQAAIRIDGFDGSVTCPAYEELCDQVSITSALYVGTTLSTPPDLPCNDFATFTFFCKDFKTWPWIMIPTLIISLILGLIIGCCIRCCVERNRDKRTGRVKVGSEHIPLNPKDDPYQ